MLIKSPHVKITQEESIFIHEEACNKLNCESCHELHNANESTYLGYIIDNKWSHKKHIDNLIEKLRRIMPKLYQLKYILNNNNKKTLYYAWIESVIRYGIEVYGFAAETYVSRLQRVQNKIIKLLFKKEELNTETLFKTHKILKIKQLRDYVVTVNNYYSDRFKPVNKEKAQILRKSTYRYEMSHPNNEYGKRKRDYFIPSIFNKIPEHLWHLPTISKVKKEMKLYFSNI